MDAVKKFFMGENPYTVAPHTRRETWLVLAPDGRVLAECPDKPTAAEVAEALWESLMRRMDD